MINKCNAVENLTLDAWALKCVYLKFFLKFQVLRHGNVLNNEYRKR
jgi:hypothetical protein